MRTRLISILALSAVVGVLAAGPAPGFLGRAVPVKCSASDVTADGRVFPEPRVSLSYVQFPDFECGIELLEELFPGLVEIRTLGKSKGGYPVYDVVVTDESLPGPKPKLLVVSSIHGNEQGGREGGLRTLEDILDPRFEGGTTWARRVLDEFAIHFVFPNPDGWVNGDVAGTDGAGMAWTRANDTGIDLNRNFPVKGWISTANRTLQESESRAFVSLFDEGGWYLGTDNHGQSTDTYAAAGLQIVGQFDFQKSETLARFADAITPAMAEYGVLDALDALQKATGEDLGPYHWGTLYDMLGYSASGSMIDYYNTYDGINGTGYATELSVGQGQNALTHPMLLNQVHVDSIRAINFTMFKQAIDPKTFSFPVGSKAAYLYDPAVVTDDDLNGEGYVRKAGETIPQQPYRVSRMRFFDDLNGDTANPLDAVRVGDILSDPTLLSRYQTLVISERAMPEGGDQAAYYAALRAFVEGGGNLVLTDGALTALGDMGIVERSAITTAKHYVGFVDFPATRTDPLLQGLRGVASQTYDTVPIGYTFGGTNTAPNWKVATSAWEAKGGRTLGTNGSGQTIYGELALGKGRIRILGALLPDPTEQYYHPYGLQNYAVTYTGYTLLENMLRLPGTAS